MFAMVQLIGTQILSENATVPEYATDGAGAVDLSASERVVVYPGEVTPVPTGLAFEIPAGHGLFISPRSGSAKKKKITIENTPGLVDSDYRGEVFVLIHNEGSDPFEIEVGDRIGQAFLVQLPRMQFVVKESLSETVRGSGGFGSTGK